MHQVILCLRGGGAMKEWVGIVDFENSTIQHYPGPRSTFFWHNPTVSLPGMG